MAKKKDSFKFLEQSTDKRETRSVAARIDSKTLDRFDKAVKIAESNGYTLSITSVIQKAIEQAIEEVSETLNIDIDQVKLPLELPTSKSK